MYYENHGKMYGGGLYTRKGAHRLSRKEKKRIFGKMMSKKELKKKLSEVNIISNAYNCGGARFITEPFCPKCGCEFSVGTGNMTSYPEIYEKHFCSRCGFLVGVADNSPGYHCLEFPEEDYVIP